MKLNKNNGATITGFLIALLSGFILIDVKVFEDFTLSRDWYKLAIPLSSALLGWLTSFNEKSLNSKAKKM